MFLDQVNGTGVTLSAIVLMPARAFFVFGLFVERGGRRAIVSSNAREGIFCFWTVMRLTPKCWIVSGSNAREGIFCFWTDFTDISLDELLTVLMPARAFFVFGHII